MDNMCFQGFYERNTRRRQPELSSRGGNEAEVLTENYDSDGNEAQKKQWRRVLLLVVAITV